MGKLLIVAALLAAGCYNPSIITKTVTIERDSTGNIIGWTEVESVELRTGSRNLRLDYISVGMEPAVNY